MDGVVMPAILSANADVGDSRAKRLLPGRASNGGMGDTGRDAGSIKYSFIK